MMDAYETLSLILLYMYVNDMDQDKISTFEYNYIDRIHKGVSLFLSCTNMNKINGLHHVKVHP